MVAYRPIRSVAVAVETVGVAPVISSPPLDLVVTETNPSFLKVVASGTQPLAYQWTKDGRPELLSTEAEFWIANPKVEDSGTYTVEVSNRCGRTMATCRLTVNPRPRRP
jgi:beta-galactosidase